MYSKSAEYDKLESFNDFFHKLIEEEGDLPSQDYFAQEYMSRFRYDSPGVQARARRAYPSLVRELHVYHMLAERFDDIYHDTDLDYNHGIDYVINQNDQTFLVHVWLDTPRSRMFRERKKGRHATSTIKGTHIDLTTTKDSGKHVGDFWLYSEQDIENFEKELIKHAT